MSVLLSFCLFFVSFAPLWLSVLFIDVMSIADASPHIVTELTSIVCILIVFLGSLIVIMRSLRPAGHVGTLRCTLSNVHEEKAITAEYLLSYILPLFAFDFTLWRQAVLFLIFFVILGYLCIRHNYFCVNIVLELLGYRFYQCKIENEDGKEIDKLIISKEQLNGSKTKTLQLRLLNNEYALCVQVED